MLGSDAERRPPPPPPSAGLLPTSSPLGSPSLEYQTRAASIDLGGSITYLVKRIKRSSTHHQHVKHHCSEVIDLDGSDEEVVDNTPEEEPRGQRELREDNLAKDDRDSKGTKTQQDSAKTKGTNRLLSHYRNEKTLYGRSSLSSSTATRAVLRETEIPSSTAVEMVHTEPWSSASCVPQKSKPLGGPKPVNRLSESAKTTKPTVRSYGKHFEVGSTSQEHNGSSHMGHRNQTEDFSGTENVLSRSHRVQDSDLEQWHAENSHSAARSSLSQPYNGNGKGGGSRNSFGKEGDKIRQQTTGPRKRDRASKGKERRASNQSSTCAGEDPNDRIVSDQDDLPVANATKKPTISFSVEIPSRATSSYQGSANLKPPRPQEPRRRVVKQQASETDPIVSEHVTKSKYFQRPTSKPQQSSETKSVRVNQDPDESIDDLSRDHYDTHVDTSHAIANALLKDLEQKERLAANTASRRQSKFLPDTGVRRPSVHVESSDDEYVDKGKIHATKFVKASEQSSVQTFKLIRAHSETKLWLSEGPNPPWSLVLDEKADTLTILDAKASLVWLLPLNKVEKYEYASDGGKLVLHTSRTARDSSTKILLDLGDVDAVERLRDYIKRDRPNLGGVKKVSDHLERVFFTTLKHARTTIKKLPQREEQDMVWMNANHEKREKDKVEAMFQKARDQKVSSVGNEIATSMRIAPQRELRSAPIAPTNFYGSSDKQADALTPTRPAARRQTRPRAASPTPPPPPERWSDSHTSWENDWKASLIYPREGKDKATVDKQDIKRLDEGEFLNDNLLVFYLRYLEASLQQKNPSLAKRVYFQNTFFYERLTSNVPRGKKINYEAVQRWTSKVNLFEYDYIIVPVNENAHWFVAIICNVKKFLDPDSEVDMPLISDSPKLKSPAAKANDGVEPGTPNEVSNGVKRLSIEDGSSEGEKPTNGNHKLDNMHVRSRGVSSDTTNAKLEVLYTGDNNEKQEDDEMLIVSDTTPNSASVTHSRPTSTQKQKRKSLPPVRKVDTSSPRIITLDSLGLSHSPTCTNLKAYLLAEIKAKHGKEVHDPPKIGLTAKHIPQQGNYCDCGVFLLMYIEMFLEKGDDFIHGLMAGSEDLELNWPEAPNLRSNIRNLLFNLQATQVVVNTQLAEEKKRNKLAKKAGNKPPKTEKHTAQEIKKSAEQTTVLSEEQHATEKKPLPDSDEVSVVVGGREVSTKSSSAAVSLPKIPKKSVVEHLSLDEDNSESLPLDSAHDVPSNKPAQGSLASRILKRGLDVLGISSTQNQEESHQPQAQVISSEWDRKPSEIKKLKTYSTRKSPGQKTSRSAPIEIPDSPEQLRPTSSSRGLQQEEKFRPRAMDGLETSNGPKQISGARRRDSQSIQQTSQSPQSNRNGRENSHNAIDVDEGEDDKVSLVPTGTARETAAERNHADDDDDEMLLKTPNRQTSGERNDPHELSDTSPWAKSKRTDSQRKIHPTTSPKPHRKASPSSPSHSRSMNNKSSPASKKRKADDELEEVRETRHHKSASGYEEFDGLDAAMVEGGKRTKFS